VKNNKDQASQAREYAFLLLKYRQRSEKELADRLKKKKFPEDVINSTLDFLRQKKFIDDNGFARAWIRERLARSIGPRRLAQELKLKGVRKQVIEDSLRETRESYSESDTVRELAASRLGRLKGLDPKAAKRRVYGYLLRRGFSTDLVIDTLNEIE
jgi:regulatory protein